MFVKKSSLETVLKVYCFYIKLAFTQFNVYLCIFSQKIHLIFIMFITFTEFVL